MDDRPIFDHESSKTRNGLQGSTLQPYKNQELFRHLARLTRKALVAIGNCGRNGLHGPPVDSEIVHSWCANLVENC